MIDTVQAAAYLGQAVVFLYKAIDYASCLVQYLPFLFRLVLFHLGLCFECFPCYLERPRVS